MLKKEIKFPKNSVYLTHSIGTGNGTFATSTLVIAHGALQNIPSAAKEAKYEGKPGIAYGHLYAAAVRSSTQMLFAELAVPRIDYR